MRRDGYEIMPIDPQRIQAVFIDAVQKSGSERDEFLNRQCAGDSELRHRVEALINAHEQSGSFLDSPLRISLATVRQSHRHFLSRQAA